MHSNAPSTSHSHAHFSRRNVENDRRLAPQPDPHYYTRRDNNSVRDHRANMAVYSRNFNSQAAEEIFPDAGRTNTRGFQKGGKDPLWLHPAFKNEKKILRIVMARHLNELQTLPFDSFSNLLVQRKVVTQENVDGITKISKFGFNRNKILMLLSIIGTEVDTLEKLGDLINIIKELRHLPLSLRFRDDLIKNPIELDVEEIYSDHRIFDEIPLWNVLQGDFKRFYRSHDETCGCKKVRSETTPSAEVITPRIYRGTDARFGVQNNDVHITQPRSSERVNLANVNAEPGVSVVYHDVENICREIRHRINLHVPPDEKQILNMARHLQFQASIVKQKKSPTHSSFVPDFKFWNRASRLDRWEISRPQELVVRGCVAAPYPDSDNRQICMEETKPDGTGMFDCTRKHRFPVYQRQILLKALFNDNTNRMWLELYNEDVEHLLGKNREEILTMTADRFKSIMMAAKMKHFRTQIRSTFNGTWKNRAYLLPSDNKNTTTASSLYRRNASPPRST